ncbi:MAG: flagellar biosynthesis protein FlhB [Candidatus Cloacimonadota bacterium]|nr:MAG: flagellar biosynthesis protein FlhB [Candidatus Cloacimonadota bacterium]
MRKKSVALTYDSKNKENIAPTIVAKGSGLIAEKINEIAKENDVYIHEDSDLVEVLVKLEVGSEIPEELFAAVAKVLAFIYKMNKK